MKKNQLAISIFVLFAFLGCEKEEPHEENVIQIVYDELLKSGMTNSMNLEDFQKSIDEASELVDVVKTIKYNEDQNITSTTIKIEPKGELDQGISIIEYIPKEVAETVDDITFSVQPSEIINRDPMVMWHLDDLMNNEEIEYSIGGQHITPGITILIKEYTVGIAFNTEKTYGSVKDVDGNIYKTIEIGNQEWMAENLRTTKYSDGSTIPHVSDHGAWDALQPSDKAYCWYENDFREGNTYGALYTWNAATNSSPGSDLKPSGVQGVCPDGWHLPSDLEWMVLEYYLWMDESELAIEGYRGFQGGYLKEEGIIHWNNPNTGADNYTGLTALPAGVRTLHADFAGMGEYTVLWSTTLHSSTRAWHRSLNYDRESIRRNDGYMENGYSVRCLKD